MDFPLQEYKERVDKARNLMHESGIDALLITDPYNYEYFSGQRVDRAHPMRKWFMVLPLDKEPAIIAYGRVLVSKEAWKIPLPSWVDDMRAYVDVPFSTEPATDWGIRRILEERGLSRANIGTELGQYSSLRMSYYDFIRLRGELPDAHFVDASKVFWGCRMIKTKREIETIRNACRIGMKSWNQLFEELETGITASEIGRKLKIHYIENGGEPTDTLIKGGSGPDRSLLKGDMLAFDGGPSYRGYQMDISRAVFFGEVPDSLKIEHRRIWSVLDTMLDDIKPGMKCCDVFRTTNEALKREGLPVIQHLKRIGHGMGLHTEPPSINELDNTIIEEGMTLTPEPNVQTKHGVLNAEEHIVVTRDGSEILSRELSRELRNIL